VLDTVPLSDASQATGKITQLSVAPLLAQAIYNIHNKKSISALFK
jgi:ribose-phosphate pyrophosphokinase